jgi:flagellar protein FliO/FliZ
MSLMTSGNFANNVVELITVLVIFLFVLGITYYVTRWIAGYQKTHTAQGNLSVLEVIRVSNSQTVQLLRLGKDQYVVIGVSKDQMTLLATLTEDEVKVLSEQDAPLAGSKKFSDILEELKKKHGK